MYFYIGSKLCYMQVYIVIVVLVHNKKINYNINTFKVMLFYGFFNFDLILIYLKIYKIT